MTADDDAQKPEGNTGFDFAAEVKQALARHPHLEPKIAFWDAQQRQMHGSRGARVLNSMNFNSFSARMSKRTEIIANGFGYGVLVFQGASTDLFLDIPPPVLKTFMFDHELGHFLGPYRSRAADTVTQECHADAYAVIRYIQRYGADSPHLAELSIMRNQQALVHGKYDHFTSPVIDRILADRGKVDFSSLTPQQTADMAKKYAEEYKPDALRLDALAKAYAPFTKLYHQNGTADSQYMTLLATTCLQSAEPPVFLAGASILLQLARTPEPQGPSARLPHVFDAEAWSMVSGMIDDRAEKLDVAHLLDAFSENRKDVEKPPATAATAPLPQNAAAARQVKTP